MTDEEWARAVPHLGPALERAGEGYSPADVRQMIEAGRAGLVMGTKSATVIRIQKAFHIWLAGGDMPELLQMEEIASDSARAQGCERMTLIGRRGWERALAPRGYVREELLVKDLYR